MGMLTSAVSKMSRQVTSTATPNAISSLGLADRATRCDSLESLTTIPSGPALAHANLSARQAKAAGLLTSGTYGQRSTGSLSSADQSSSWVSRLQAATDSLGSTLYRLTWKERVTPSGRLICAQRASVLRTSGSGCIGWPTPQAFDATNDGMPRALRYKGNAQSEAGNTRNPNSPGSYRGDLKDWVALAGWCSPTATDASRGGLPPRPHDTGIPLTQQVAIAGPARLTASGERLTGSSAAMASGGQLSPHMSRWLMGYPVQWDTCAPSAKPKKG